MDTQEVKLVDVFALANRVEIWAVDASPSGMVRCVGFCNALRELHHPLDYASPSYLGRSYPFICADMAERALKHGVPVATINLLTAVHFT